MDERAEFEKWVASLPNCVGDDGACDGNLVGLDHEPHCPMFGKEDITFFDIWQAARVELRSRSSALVEGIKRLAKELRENREGVIAEQRRDGRPREKQSSICLADQAEWEISEMIVPLESLVPPDPQKEKDAPKT